MATSRERAFDVEEEEEDFLEEMLREREKRSPHIREMVDALVYQRQSLRALAAKRTKLGVSEEEIATRIGITPDELESLERGEADPQLSTISRYAAALGKKLELRLSPLKEAGAAPAEQKAPGESSLAN